MQESRIKCGIPGGIKFSSQVGKVGSHHLGRDPAIPTWDPGWDCRDPTYIPPDILPGSYRDLLLKLDLFLDSRQKFSYKSLVTFLDAK